MPNYWGTQSVTPVPPGYQLGRPIVDWTIGKAGADAYPMGPSGKVMLLDTQEPVMYVKTTDAVGRVSILVYDLVERKPVVAEPAGSSEIDYDRIRKMIAEEIKKAKTSTAKKAKEDD